MEDKTQLSHTLDDIKQMMERSSRFISLSGFSGVAAGACALVGAWFAYDVIYTNKETKSNLRNNIEQIQTGEISIREFMGSALFNIAVMTFVAAFLLAFIFTWVRSKKTNVPIWGTTARRLMINVSLPMIVGGIFLLKLIEKGVFGFIAPGCLVFYGLALMNASKYTLPEIRTLGYSMIVLGLINLFFIGYGLYFWAVGFGLLHIIYGVAMWWKYERRGS